MAPPFNWWGKEEHRGTPVIVKMENPDWSMVEISSNDDEDDEDVTAGDFSVKKGGRGKNAKQITWVLLLKAHRAAGCLTSLASATLGLASAVRRRVRSGRTDSEPDAVPSLPEESPVLRSRFYSCITLFLWLSVVLLGFEIAAYFKGWHLGAPDLQRLMAFSAFGSSFGVHDAFDSVYSGWVRLRVEYIAPVLQFLTNACVVLFMIQSADRLILCLGCFWIKFKGIKPVMVETQDPEKGGGDYPMVLIQMPMCNEKEVYQQSIAAVCDLDWPRSNMLVQVLDDSDDLTTQMLIKDEVKKWKQTGVQIVYRHRVIRDGYKAGNLTLLEKGLIEMVLCVAN